MLAAVTFTAVPTARAQGGPPGPVITDFNIGTFLSCSRVVSWEALVAVSDPLPERVDVTAIDPNGEEAASSTTELQPVEGDLLSAVSALELEGDPIEGEWTFVAVATDAVGATSQSETVAAAPGPCDPVIDGFALTSEPPIPECADQTLTFVIGAEDPQADLETAMVTLISPSGDVTIEATAPYTTQGDISVDALLPAGAESGTWTVVITVTDSGGRTDAAEDVLEVPDRSCVEPPTPPNACPALEAWTPSPSASPALAGWWPFDDATPGGHLADGLGNFAVGTEFSGATGISDGFLNEAEQFDGSSAVDVPGPVNFGGTGSETLTIDLMVRTTDTRGVIVEHRTIGTGASNVGDGFLLMTWAPSRLLIQTPTQTSFSNDFLDFPSGLLYDLSLIHI